MKYDVLKFVISDKVGMTLRYRVMLASLSLDTKIPCHVSLSLSYTHTHTNARTLGDLRFVYILLHSSLFSSYTYMH